MNFNEISRIGIVGGGSGALMLALEAASKGIHTILLDPQINCVGADIVSEHIIATITNESIQKLSLRADAVIFNTNLSFKLSAKLHSPCYPSKEVMNQLSAKREIIELLEALEIPMLKTYHQDNRADTFSKIDTLTFPFRFIKQYKDRIESMDIFNEEDLGDFILEEDQADSFILQPITSYSSIIACLAVVNKEGKIVLYDPLEETFEEEALCTIQAASSLSKTMIQKIGRYNRKIMKEIGSAGVFTIKYGLKSNKGVELIEITPELPLSGILTIEAYDMSVYEQYLHMILDMEIAGPKLVSSVHGIVKQNKAVKPAAVPYHIYNIGVTRLCVTLNNE